KYVLCLSSNADNLSPISLGLFVDLKNFRLRRERGLSKEQRHPPYRIFELDPVSTDQSSRIFTSFEHLLCRCNRRGIGAKIRSTYVYLLPYGIILLLGL